MRDELNRALRDVPVPEPVGAEERGRRVVEAALAERQSGRSELRGAMAPKASERRSGQSLPRLALGLGIATLLVALLLSPAGAAVRSWVDDVFTAGAPRPEPTLGEIPGGGRLLVQSAAGPWVVQPDGSRRLLGDYDEASWSPRGLFVAAAEGRTLSALEPDGTPHWSITAAARVSDQRWSPTPGERIAYRSGRALQVIAGDGTDDRLLAEETAPVAPAWSPFGDPSLAYVSGAGALRIANTESLSELAAAPALPGIAEIEWGAGGRAILEASRKALRLRDVHLRKLRPQPSIRRTRELPVEAGATVVDAALAPWRPAVAAVQTHWRDHGTYSSVVLYGAGGGARRLLTVPGSLGEVTWSPDGRRLLVAWPAVNQWLFLPIGRGRQRAVANISDAFSPGGRPASFPRLEGWCCRG